MISNAAEDPQKELGLGENEDDDMEELFSFGSEDPGRTGEETTGTDLMINSASHTLVSATTNSTEGALIPPLPVTRERSDSLMEMLAQEQASALGSLSSSLHHHHHRHDDDLEDAVHDPADHDQETQDILDWLDHGEAPRARPPDEEGQDTIVFDAAYSQEDGDEQKQSLPDLDNDDNKENQQQTISPSSSSLSNHPPAGTTVVQLPPTFATLEEALASAMSTPAQIRALYAQEQPWWGPTPQDHHHHHHQLRAQLYCRMICGKTLEEVQQSSWAISWASWQPPAEGSETSGEAEAWIRNQAQDWAPALAAYTQRETSACQVDLTQLLLYHYYHHHPPTLASSSSPPAALTDPSTEGSASSTSSPSAATQTYPDALIPPVAAALLATQVPLPTAGVLLTQIIPHFLPLLALKPTERWEAALALHTHWHVLACYHLPLLVFHLDRYLPGWYWPQFPSTTTTMTEKPSSSTALGRNLEQRGQIPASWLLSHLAPGAHLPLAVTLPLWDRLLTLADNKSGRFFLTLAVLEQASDDLILSTGNELLAKLQAALDWPQREHDQRQQTASSSENKVEWLKDWWSRARALQNATPSSVVQQLHLAEDDAVQQVLQQRQQRAETELQTRLEAEAAAHREAQEKKADEARDRLARARLVAFYRQYAPDKEENIDKIMSFYKGRYEDLDIKLKNKYGHSFNPPIKPKVSKPVSLGANKLLATMNQGLGSRRQQSTAEEETAPVENSKLDKVAVTVSPAEVLPALCWTKASSSSRTEQRRSRALHRQLRFFLVDSRSESAAQEQGRFPTAIGLGPEILLDPDQLEEKDEMFESLRGTVHIVVMGEGFSAIPKLYDQKLSSKLEDLMREDESRANMCALFFIKKGFPFVSILEGGFAAAHSWLVRQGPSRQLNAAAVLVDYNPDNSLFGQMETYYNASSTEKVQRTMQNLLETSIVAMTLRAQQLEKLAMDLETKRNRQGLRLSFFRSQPEGADSGDQGEKGKLSFKIPFANLGRATVASVGTNSAGEASELSSDESRLHPTTGEDVSGPSIPGFRNPFTRKQINAEGVESSSTEKQIESGTDDTKEKNEPRFKIPFTGMGKAPSTADESGPTDSLKETSKEKTESRFKIPFAGMTKASTGELVVEATPDSKQTPAVPDNKPIAPEPQQPPMSVNLGAANPFGMFRPVSAKPKEEAKDGAAPSNPFKGLGSALNNTMKTSTGTSTQQPAATTTTSSHAPGKNLLSRNPFARFGGGGGHSKPDAPAPAKSTPATSAPKTSGGFGLGQLRMSTISRMRPPNSKDEEDIATTVAEESISFDLTDSGPDTNPSSDKNQAEAHVQRV